MDNNKEGSRLSNYRPTSFSSPPVVYVGQGDLGKIIDVVRRNLCFLSVYMGNPRYSFYLAVPHGPLLSRRFVYNPFD